MIKVGIIGGGGYTAGELIRLVLLHPNAELVSVVSESQSKLPISSTHLELNGWLDMNFSDHLEDNLDVVFLCSGHGRSDYMLKKYDLSKSTKVIDLSADYRLKKNGNEFVYGLPELNREIIKDSTQIANPGCFATCIQLSLLPLADKNELNEDIHCTAITGSTGAGRLPSSTTHFSWRSNNASIYKAFTHQHLDEIKQSLHQLQSDFSSELHFIPMRGAFTRGILAASYLTTTMSLREAIDIYRQYYKHHPFVEVIDYALDVKMVVNTNRALLSIQKEGKQLLITGVIDNLSKGASGQAVQNMNIMFGVEETTGLNLKPSVF